ncbi:recombinase family protein [Planctomycetes bacterium TBK1r]|uniref:Resolvase/invertase-type recombinase catalytic domain-containing protein n=1 Tax=Stieleria magnilauensis TaxID=2527963 RepID=A0ABX5XT89_9BACT|nr:hypothetical protein TBK1r_42090 [Planctomycetes bacterium TBK1r]
MSPTFDRCAIYTRQSRSSSSVLSSCEAQQRICRDMAEVFKWNIVDVFEDLGQSSETLMRPAMQRMSTNASSRGNIRYRHYQCRSTAGGRPPCPSVWLNAWDMEEFVAARIGTWEASPELAKTFRNDWPSMVSE